MVFANALHFFAPILLFRKDSGVGSVFYQVSTITLGLGGYWLLSLPVSVFCNGVSLLYVVRIGIIFLKSLVKCIILTVVLFWSVL